MAPIKFDETNENHVKEVSDFAKSFKEILDKTPNTSFSAIMNNLADNFGYKVVDKKFKFAVEAWNRVSNKKISDKEAIDIYESQFGTINPGRDFAFINSGNNISETESFPSTEEPAIEESLKPSESVMDEKVNDEKKSFKSLIGDVTSLFFGAVFFLGIIGAQGYFFYRDFISLSSQLQYFIIGMLLFISLLGSVLYSIPTIGFLGFSFKKFIDRFGLFGVIWGLTLILLIVPIVVILINVLIFILTNWFIWIVIISLFLLFTIWNSSISLLNKIFLITLLLLSIYFLFEAKDILKFQFQPYFDNKILRFVANDIADDI